MTIYRVDPVEQPKFEAWVTEQGWPIIRGWHTPYDDWQQYLWVGWWARSTQAIKLEQRGSV